MACMTLAGISALHMAGVSRSRLASNSRALVRNVLHCVMDDSCTVIASCACSSLRTSLLACGRYSMHSDDIVMLHDCLEGVKYAQRHRIRPADAAELAPVCQTAEHPAYFALACLQTTALLRCCQAQKRQGSP